MRIDIVSIISKNRTNFNCGIIISDIFHINFEGFIYSTTMSNQNQIENSCEIGGVIITITIIALGIGIIGFLVWFLVFGLDL